MSKQCGYCVYLDTTREQEGRFKCEKQSKWNFANSTEAENCYKYCERFRRDMYLGDAAIKASKSYQDSHREYQGTGCYITTVTVNILGLEDDCEELNVLRKFRRDYLQKLTSCKDILIKYDALGPALAKAIVADENSFDVALDLFNIYIKGAVSYIKAGKYKEAIVLYSEMTNNLMKKYLSSYMIPDGVRENYDMENAGHGKITMK